MNPIATRLDLRGRQRRHFILMAAGCTVAAFAGPLLLRQGGPWFYGGWAVLMMGVALYYLRIAYGWVELDHHGIRTSRLLRGRAIPWAEVEDFTVRRYRGHGGGVTVVKVHTTAGRSYFLPVPRTTQWNDPGFAQAVDDLRARIPVHPSG